MPLMYKYINDPIVFTVCTAMNHAAHFWHYQLSLMPLYFLTLVGICSLHEPLGKYVYKYDRLFRLW